MVLAGTFLGGLDTYIVSLALPRIAADLDVGPTAVGWILLAYLLAIGALVVLLGRLADLHGTRPVLVGIAVASTLWVTRHQAYERSLEADAAMALAFRDTFVVLALVGAIGAIISALRDRPP